MKYTRLLFFAIWGLFPLLLSAQSTQMMYGDTSRKGVPFSKDPHVVRFAGRYLMYFSIPPHKDHPSGGWNIGIAESQNLIDWKKVGEILPEADYEKKGLCAPGALVRDGKVHLFYQIYGKIRHFTRVQYSTYPSRFSLKKRSSSSVLITMIGI